MKKILSLFLALLMVLSLIACGSDVGDEGDIVDEPAIKDAENLPADDTDAEVTPVNYVEGNFGELVIIDNEKCKLILREDAASDSLELVFENKSAESTYAFGVNEASINDVHCIPFVLVKVLPGETANKIIDFSKPVFGDVSAIKPEDYMDIELVFTVYYSDEYYYADEEEAVHIYPNGKNKATSFVREQQPTDTVIVDNEYVTLLVTGYESEYVGKRLDHYAADFYIVNKTDVDIFVYIQDVYVNGYTCDPYYEAVLPAGNMLFDSMVWEGELLGEHAITEVEDIELMLSVYEWTGMSSDFFVEDRFMLNP